MLSPQVLVGELSVFVYIFIFISSATLAAVDSTDCQRLIYTTVSQLMDVLHESMRERSMETNQVTTIK